VQLTVDLGEQQRRVGDAVGAVEGREPAKRELVVGVCRADRDLRVDGLNFGRRTA
jgi:hypothetical protein